MKTETILKKEQRKEASTFSTPLNSTEKARLEITNGVSNLDLTGDPSTFDLFQAQFSSLIPEVYVQNGTVRIRYRLSLAESVKHTLLWKPHAARVSLNTSIPWDINLRGGVANLQADLRKTDLKSLTFSGGISQAEILLPRPSGHVAVYVMGGASKLTFLLPDGVKVQLRVHGGASNLTFGSQSFGGLGGKVDFETPGYEEAADRYEIRVFSGATHLTVNRQE
jgi:hypothetical protein